VLLSATVLGLAGCVNAEKSAPAGAGDSVSFGAAPTTTQASESASSPAATQTSSTHNQADVTFANQAVLLRQQAVTMADKATTSSTSAQVKTLAGQISKDNVSAATLTAWLAQWGQPAPSSTGQATGVLPAAQLQQLVSASGTSFDMQWLQDMKSNLTAAQTASTTESSHGSNPQAKQLATQWGTTLKAELATLGTIG
jgi:uncharacterized protein (DUF305 family)